MARKLQTKQDYHRVAVQSSTQGTVAKLVHYITIFQNNPDRSNPVVGVQELLESMIRKAIPMTREEFAKINPGAMMQTVAAGITSDKNAKLEDPWTFATSKGLADVKDRHIMVSEVDPVDFAFRGYEVWSHHQTPFDKLSATMQEHCSILISPDKRSTFAYPPTAKAPPPFLFNDKFGYNEFSYVDYRCELKIFPTNLCKQTGFGEPESLRQFQKKQMECHIQRYNNRWENKAAASQSGPINTVNANASGVEASAISSPVASVGVDIIASPTATSTQTAPKATASQLVQQLWLHFQLLQLQLPLNRLVPLRLLVLQLSRRRLLQS